MLNILVTNDVFDNTIYNIDAYFNSAYEPEWIDNDFAKAMIEDVDKSKVVAPRIIDSPFLGYIDPTHISGGVKCVLCMLFDDEVDGKRMLDITVCGDNCAPWIQRAGEMRELTVQLGYPMRFFDVIKTPIRIVNNNTVVHNMDEFLDVYLEYAI